MFSFAPRAGLVFAPSCPVQCHHVIIGGYVLIGLAFVAIIWAIERRV